MVKGLTDSYTLTGYVLCFNLKIGRSKVEKYIFKLVGIIVFGANVICMRIKPSIHTDISYVMRWIFSVTAKRYNRIFKTKGKFWYDRYKSKIIAAE